VANFALLAAPKALAVQFPRLQVEGRQQAHDNVELHRCAILGLQLHLAGSQDPTDFVDGSGGA
jgi:hypothetical protein